MNLTATRGLESSMQRVPLLTPSGLRILVLFLLVSGRQSRLLQRGTESSWAQNGMRRFYRVQRYTPGHLSNAGCPMKRLKRVTRKL